MDAVKTQRAMLGLQNQQREVLAGAIPLLRQLRDSGAPTCDHTLPAEQAPLS